MRPVKATPRHDAHDDAAANSSRVSGVLSLSLSRATSCHRNDDDPEGQATGNNDGRIKLVATTARQDLRA